MLLLPNHSSVLNAFAALANAAPGKANFDYHVSYIKDFGVAGYSSALNQIFAGVTDRDLASLILNNLGLGGVFTLDVAESFIAANAGDRVGAVLSLASALYNYSGSEAGLVAAKAAYVSKVDYSYNYSAVQGNAAASNFPSSYDVNTHVLSSGVETLIGSAANDVFKGITPDALSSGDVLHGGAGNDLLDAVLAATPYAIRAVTTGIETVAVSAQSSAAYSNGNNNINQQQVTVDAHEMQGVTKWENNNSRADLIVEDVRIASNQITKDITVAMVETDPGSVDYGVYFDQLSLRTTTNSTSQLNLQVMDTASLVAGTAPLLNSPYRGFKFTVTDANGVTGPVTLESDAIDAAQTYAELATAFQAAADAVFGAGVVTVSVGKAYTATDTTTGTTVSGNEITIAAAGAYTFTTPAGSGWVAAGVVPANSGLHTNFNTAASSATDLVTVKVILDDVGRGSTGGDLMIGGLSTGITSTSKGVERFEIEVRDNSKLQNIESTNNTLKEVVLTNGVTSSSSSAYTTTVKDQGKLTVRGTVEGDGDVALPGSTGGDVYGFNDVRLIDGSAFKGNLDISAQFSEASITKYVQLSDTNANPAADTVAVEYKGGSGDDTLVVNIDGVAAASRSSIVSGREDFTFKVEGGAGDDKITLTVNQNAGGSDNWYYNQNLNNNITIDAGAGNDVIRTPGAGDKKIDAGAGNDVVYSDNTGAGTYTLTSAVNTTDKGTWVFNTAGQTIDALDGANRNLNDIRSDVNDSYNLFKATVQVKFKGLESRVITLANTTTYKTTDLEINQAIKDAINNDAVLKNLLVAKDGPANSLVVESLIDGVMAVGDLGVTLTAPANNLTTAELAAVNAAWKTTYTTGQEVTAMGTTVGTFTTKSDYSTKLANDGATVITGEASTTTADNFITVGTGDDVVVLGTTLNSGGLGVEWSSNEVVIFGAGFGTDTIVNYAATGNGIDHLDFTAILGGAAGVVASSESIATARTVSVTTETTANDTVDEIKVLYNLIDATTSGAASKHLYVAAGTGDNVGKAKVYSVVDGAADNDVTVTLEGTVDLGSVAWTGLTLANFQVPSATAEGPANLAGTVQTGTAGNDTLTGSAFNDQISGLEGNDIISGLAGDDTLNGGAGNDNITGGAGVDTITLGAGTDTVVIAAADLTNANRDVVTDFVVADDSIQINGVALVNAGGATLDNGAVVGEFQTAAAAAAYTVAAGELVLELNFAFDTDVSLAAATKATLLSALGAADNAAAGVTAGTLTMGAAGNQALVIGYQGGNAYLFKVTSGADADITVADADDLVELVGTYQNVAVGAFTDADFIA